MYSKSLETTEKYMVLIAIVRLVGFENRYDLQMARKALQFPIFMDESFGTGIYKGLIQAITEDNECEFIEAFLNNAKLDRFLYDAMLVNNFYKLYDNCDEKWVLLTQVEAQLQHSAYTHSTPNYGQHVDAAVSYMVEHNILLPICIYKKEGKVIKKRRNLLNAAQVKFKNNSSPLYFQL